MVLRKLIEKITGRSAKKKKTAAVAALSPAPQTPPAPKPAADPARKPEARRPERPTQSESRPASSRGRPDRRHSENSRPGGDTRRPVAAPRPPASPWDPAAHSVPIEEGKLRFQDLPLCVELQHACADLGFKYCTPIQKISLPAALAGKDVSGQAQTGTGKTAAFLLSIFQHFVNHPRDIKPGHPRALIIAPTRELALQIGRDAEKLGAHLPYRTVAVFGGQEMDKQRKLLVREPVHILAATPGRLLDFQRRRDLSLSEVEILVLDEADRMLDMGFIPDVRRIIQATPPRERRQTMLFSATLSPDILRLASQWTRDPIRLEVEDETIAAQTVDQVVYIVTTQQKTPLLIHLLRRTEVQRTLLFVNRRDTGEHVADLLNACGFQAGLISGALSQERRSKTLESFREGRIPIVVATDVAGRGIHIDGVSHVINYNLPQDAEDYVHRIGRTGRAGAQGTSISFASEDESFYIPDIEKFMGRELPCIRPDDAWLDWPDDLMHLKNRVPEPRRSAPREPFRGGRRPISRGPRRR